ncbi:bifunctional oligoribonuclease/PAP phosphatase NrnA [bacterium]|nr:bifunctional oligoribonuclease/PAP phosphatase NrnA [bacterium]
MPIPEVLKELRESESFLVTVHINPDGDAIGALLGMVRLLEAMGKRAVPVLPKPVPERYHFMSGSDKVSLVEQAGKLGPFDGIVILDAGDYDRIGEVQSLVKDGMRIVNIDHHLSNDSYGNAAYIDTGASATCEMLVDLFRTAKIAIEPDVAELLYTGIMTDTGRFRFSNTTPKVFATCANLVSRGADPDRISKEIYFRTKYETTVLMGHVLTRLLMFADGQIAFSHLDPSEEGMDTEGFIDHLVAITTVEVAVLLRPIGPDEWKISFRATGDVNVSDLAQLFGGGGHAKAAGGIVKGPIDEARKLVVDACIKALPSTAG